MAHHFHHSSNHQRYLLIAAGTAVAVIAAGGVAFAALGQGSAGQGGRRSASGARATTTTTTPPPPLVVGGSSPTGGATAVTGTQPITFTTTAKVDLAAQQPTVSPAVPGSWSSTATQLTFTPAGAFPAQTKVTVTLPAGLASTDGARLGSAQTLSFTTADGSLLRAQQLLAKLGYLPLSWTPTTPLTTDAQRQQAVYTAPPGNFAWTWSSPPPTLVSQWTPGVAGPMTKGAVMAFESDHSLATDGIVGQGVWAALLSATATPNPTVNPHGYTYALANQTLPETLTVWHNNTVISTSPANTGIAASPTADGTFPVFERLAKQVMRGTNPGGSTYADPVAWVAYFNGGDAVHYIPRSSYGSRQSLGCVEVTYQTGQTVWPYLTIGSLVTVVG